LVCKDVFDQAIYMEFVASQNSDTVLAFLIHAWQHLGIPDMVQFDNGRAFCGWGAAARSLSRVIRLALRLQGPADARRQVKRLMTTVNEQHVHTHLGHQTTMAYRRGKALRKLPANCQLHQEKLPISVGKVSFIRLVNVNGTVNVLSQPFQVGRRLKFQYIKATLYTKEHVLKIYHQGRLVKQFEYNLPVK